jgi:hypothetical protein
MLSNMILNKEEESLAHPQFGKCRISRPVDVDQRKKE